MIMLIIIVIIFKPAHIHTKSLLNRLKQPQAFRLRQFYILKKSLQNTALHALCQHRIGNLQESGNIGSGNQITLGAVLPGGVIRAVEYVGHNIF